MGLKTTIKTIKISNIVGTSLIILKNLEDLVYVFVGREELDFNSESNIKHYFNKHDKFNIVINCSDDFNFSSCIFMNLGGVKIFVRLDKYIYSLNYYKLRWA